ncbi:stage II sporulation protein M [Paenibacillaceae bacterium]|nr:stage II sporulation protein M [Paenibacillaceae bacterium]
MFSWRAIGNHFVEMRSYFVIALILLLAGMFVGASNEQLEAFLNSQLSGLEQFVKTADASSNPQLTMFFIIFFNNVIKCIVVMYLGALFGIIPILFIFVNGMVMGYLFNMIHTSGENLFLIIVKGILPHGIIEIPALIVACAYGLKFGTLGFRGIANLVRQVPGIGLEYEKLAIRSVPITVILIVSLLAAAVIESTLTVWLLGK